MTQHSFGIVSHRRLLETVGRLSLSALLGIYLAGVGIAAAQAQDRGPLPIAQGAWVDVTEQCANPERVLFYIGGQLGDFFTFGPNNSMGPDGIVNYIFSLDLVEDGFLEIDSGPMQIKSSTNGRAIYRTWSNVDGEVGRRTLRRCELETLPARFRAVTSRFAEPLRNTPSVSDEPQVGRATTDEDQIRAVVAGIYSAYQRPIGEGPDPSGYLSPRLRALEERASDPDIGLGADAFCECQDYDETAADHRIDAVLIDAPDQARARVAFRVFEGPLQPTTLHFRKINGRWLVDDVESPREGLYSRTLSGGAGG